MSEIYCPMCEQLKKELATLQERVALLSEPGTAGRVLDWAHRYAESEFGRSPFLSDSPADYIVKGVAELRVKLAACEAETKGRRERE